MPVLVDVKRAAFRQLYSSAVAQATTIQEALAAAIAPSLAAALAGKQLIEAQSGGTVTRYQLPAELAAQTPDVAAMWGQLQDLYDRALMPAASVPPGGGCSAETAGAPSAAIYAWMMGQLTVVRSAGTDHTWANIRI